MTGEKTENLIDMLPVLFFADQALTGCVALFNVILQTGSFFPDIPWK